MMMLKLVQAVAALAVTVTNWLHDRQLINLAKKAAWGQNLQEANDALDRAHTARTGAELDADLHPGRLHDDDGFKRD